MKTTFFALALCLPLFAHAEVQKLTYDFSYGKPEIVTEGKTSHLVLKNLPQSLDQGKPVLPFEQVKILIPANAEIQKLNVIRLGVQELSFNGELEIYKGMLPLSFNTSPKALTTYSLTKNEPEALGYQSLQSFHGYKVLLAKLNPVFISPEKKIFYSNQIKVELEVSMNDEKALSTNLNLKNNQDEIAQLVDERSLPALDSYLAGAPLFMADEERYDYLIVTTAELMAYTGENSLSTFKKFLEETRGLKVKIVDEKIVESQMTGVDRAEKLRNFLKTEYAKFSPKYLLLVGDSSGMNPQIPNRSFASQVKGYDGSWKIIKQNIVSDFYYSCLDGSFDGNKNGIWGERTDGENGGDVDFLCELTVGRWPVAKVADLNTVVSKTLQGYQLNSRSKNVLFLGEVLFEQLGLFGGDYMDKLIGEVTDHNFTTKGYDSTWNMAKLYDTANGDAWSGSSVKKLIDSSDFLMINHLGHSNQQTNMKLNSYSFRGFANKNPYFFYTQGCFAGHFPTSGFIAGAMLTKPGGPFALMANSNYGLGPEDPDYNSTKTPGTSQILHRFFVNRVLGSHYLAFGEAHQKSKEDLLIYINYDEARWVTWIATFFGDPALKP